MRNLVVVWLSLALLGGMTFLSSPATAEENLLRNASLLLDTNPGFPDFWGGQSGWRPAAHRLTDNAFIPGTRSMTLIGQGEGPDIRFYTANYGWSPGQADTPYTFSVYLKAEPAGLKAVIGGKRLEEREVDVGASWQNYRLTVPLKAAKGFSGRFLNVGVSLKARSNGKLYINAPMLVRGVEPAEYAVAAIEKDRLSADRNAPVTKAASVSLLGEWIMDKPAVKDAGGSYVITDRSGQGNNGRIIGNPSWVSTPYGEALYFDGKTYVEVPYSPSLQHDADNLTIEMQLKPDSGQAMPLLIRGMHFGGYALRIQYGKYSSIITPWKSFDGGSVIPRPEHLTVTFKRPEVRIYLGGEVVGKGELNASMNPVANNRPLFIGAFDEWTKERKGYGPSPGFKGWIRMVRIYKGVLSEGDIKERSGQR